MYDPEKLGEMQQLKEEWEKNTLKPTLSRFSERQDEFMVTIRAFYSSEALMEITALWVLPNHT